MKIILAKSFLISIYAALAIWLLTEGVPEGATVMLVGVIGVLVAPRTVFD